MIPKIIHYCWFSKDKNKELPKAVQRSIESWKRILPDYEIRLWNGETFDVVGQVKTDYWQGRKTLQLIINDLRKVENE